MLQRRRTFIRLADRIAPYVVVALESDLFVAPVSDGGKLLVSGSRSEFVVIARAVSALRQTGRLDPGGTLIDVGANIGTTTVAALFRHGFGRAIAIEPDPENLRLLRANVALNGVERQVAVIPAAASVSAGRASFDRRDRKSGWKSGSGRLVDGVRDGVVEVDTVSLDGLAAAGAYAVEDVGLLWLDVQGHESRVLEGASDLLDKAVPVVLSVRPRQILGNIELERLQAVLAATYTSFVDLRHPTLKPPWTPVYAPIGQLPDLVRAGRATDILAVR